MKNFLILGLLAALLFSVSAALSLWLNQSKQPTEGDKGADKDKAGSKNPSKPGEKESPEPRPSPKPEPSTGTDSTAIAVMRDRELKLERRAAQIELVLNDLRVERERVEALLRQVTTELKTASNRSNELELLAAELEKKKLEFNAAERMNIVKMAAMYDTMPPESAAPIMKQMAESGRMDTAVKILAQMKERSAARVLAELSDPALAAQLLDKMRGLKAATPATAASIPGSTVVPAKGP